MTELLVVPVKQSFSVDVEQPVKKWIQAKQGATGVAAPLIRWIQSNLNREVEDVSAKLVTLRKLRQEVIGSSTESTETKLANASNYYDQISGLEAATSDEVQIWYQWKNAFERRGWTKEKPKMPIPSFHYEKICVLFNIAAFNSRIASEQNFETMDGLQRAAKRLQTAAGTFSHLREHSVARMQTELTSDLDPETLGTLSDLMLAQAQEMVALKAISDNMKAVVIAKLCSQCHDMFSGVAHSMQSAARANAWDSDWISNVCCKQAIYGGLSQYHQSKVCSESKEMGEEIARLEFAKRLLTSGIEKGRSGLCSGKTWLSQVEVDLKEAHKNNDFIYHAVVPEEKALAPVAKVAVAKPTPMPEKLGDPSALLLFQSSTKP